VLPAFPEALSAYTLKALTCLGVEVKVNSKVLGMDSRGVALEDGALLPSACVIWAAGVASSPVAKWLGVEPDRAGRTPVLDDLSIEGQRSIFVIGDCALARARNGKPLPGLAPVAKQQGEYVGRLITGMVQSSWKSWRPFRYKDFGSLATIGRKIAVADFGALRLRGLAGWLTWCLAHVYFLIGFRNRFSVIADWVWSYLTFQRGSRLITGSLAPASTQTNDAATRQAA
jgi:NADH dehydrogenase